MEGAPGAEAERDEARRENTEGAADIGLWSPSRRGIGRADTQNAEHFVLAVDVDAGS